MQFDRLGASLKHDVHLVIEAVFLVVGHIGFGAGFEVHGFVLDVGLFQPLANYSGTRMGRIIYLGSHMLDQLPSISLSARRRFAAQVNEVVGVVVSVAHHIMLCVVQEREEFLEETLLAFGGELVVKSPEATTKDRPEAVDVCSGLKPCFLVSL